MINQMQNSNYPDYMPYGQNYRMSGWQGTPYGMNMGAPQSLKGRPVSSLDEVRAAQIDFDGSLYVFPDIANKKIYSKQISLDGTAAIKIYSLMENVTPESNYVTREELNSALSSLQETINVLSERKENSNEKTVSTNGGKPAIAF